MKRFLVTFVVEGEDVHDALRQAERYLNAAGGRAVDCNVEGPMVEGEKLYGAAPPVTAPRLGDP